MGSPIPNEDVRSKERTIEVNGVLTVGGHSQNITFNVRGIQYDEDRSRAIVQIPLRMSDLNIEPPTGMMGMVKALDEIVVHYDLIAGPSSGTGQKWRLRSSRVINHCWHLYQGLRAYRT